MAYLRYSNDESRLGAFGCGQGCQCTSRRLGSFTLAERYIPEEDQAPEPGRTGEWGPYPFGVSLGGGQRLDGLGDRACPEPARTATDRCTVPQPCPAISNLLCVREVNGIPFEYVERVSRSPATGLLVPADRIPNRQQRFVPAVKLALSRFINDMARFAMRIEWNSRGCGSSG
jgi:hypothetical protein